MKKLPLKTIMNGLKEKKKIVILDSNFILLPFQFKIDYLREISDLIIGEIIFIIYQQVYDELDAKKRRFPNAVKFQKHYDSGLLYLEKNRKNYNIQLINEIKNSSEKSDDFLLRKAIELYEKGKKIFFATNDYDLRRKARKNDLNVIYLRQKKYLSIG